MEKRIPKFAQETPVVNHHAKLESFVKITITTETVIAKYIQKYIDRKEHKNVQRTVKA